MIQTSKQMTIVLPGVTHEVKTCIIFHKGTLKIMVRDNKQGPEETYGSLNTR